MLPLPTNNEIDGNGGGIREDDVGCLNFSSHTFASTSLASDDRLEGGSLQDVFSDAAIATDFMDRIFAEDSNNDRTIEDAGPIFDPVNTEGRREYEGRKGRLGCSISKNNNSSSSKSDSGTISDIPHGNNFPQEHIEANTQDIALNLFEPMPLGQRVECQRLPLPQPQHPQYHQRASCNDNMGFFAQTTTGSTANAADLAMGNRECRHSVVVDSKIALSPGQLVSGDGSQAPPHGSFMDSSQLSDFVMDTGMIPTKRNFNEPGRRSQRPRRRRATVDSVAPHTSSQLFGGQLLSGNGSQKPLHGSFTESRQLSEFAIDTGMIPTERNFNEPGPSSQRPIRRRATVDSVAPDTSSQLFGGHLPSGNGSQAPLHESFTESGQLSKFAIDTGMIPTERNSNEPGRSSQRSRRRRATVDLVAPDTSRQLFGGHLPSGNSSQASLHRSFTESRQPNEFVMDTGMIPTERNFNESGRSSQRPRLRRATVDLVAPDTSSQLFGGHLPSGNGSQASPHGSFTESRQPSEFAMNTCMIPTECNFNESGRSSQRPLRRRATVDSAAPHTSSQLFGGQLVSGNRSQPSPHGSFTESRQLSEFAVDTGMIPTELISNEPGRSSQRPRRRRATADSAAPPTFSQLFGGLFGNDDVASSDATFRESFTHNLQCSKLVTNAAGAGEMGQSGFGSLSQNSCPGQRATLDSAQAPDFSGISPNGNNPQSHINADERGMGILAASHAAPSSSFPQEGQHQAAVDLSTATPSPGSHGQLFSMPRTLIRNLPPLRQNTEAVAMPAPIKTQSRPKRRRATVDHLPLVPNLEDLQSRIKNVDNVEEMDQWIAALTETRKLLSNNVFSIDAPPPKTDHQPRPPVPELQQQQHRPRRRVTVDSGMAPNLGQNFLASNGSKAVSSVIIHQTSQVTAEKNDLQLHEAFQKLAESRHRTELSRRQLEMLQPHQLKVDTSAKQQLQQRVTGSP